MSHPLAQLDERLQALKDLPYVFVAYLDLEDMSNVSAVMHDHLDLQGEVFRLYQLAVMETVSTFSKFPPPQLAALTGCEVWKG